MFSVGPNEQIHCLSFVALKEQQQDQPRWHLESQQSSLGQVCSWEVERLGPGGWCLLASAMAGVLDPSLVVGDPKIPLRRK